MGLELVMASYLEAVIVILSNFLPKLYQKCVGNDKPVDVVAQQVTALSVTKHPIWCQFFPGCFKQAP